MADGELFKPGRFLTHRTLGSVVADSATINTTNFPPQNSFSGYQCQSVWITWHGTGGTASDTIKFVPLVFDGINNVWNLMSEITVTKDTLYELSVYGASTVYLRVSNVSGTSATAPITINIAKAHSEVVE